MGSLTLRRRAGIAILAAICLLLGVAVSAAALALVPNQGSPPAIFDDFDFSSVSNGYWHVYAQGAQDRITNSSLYLAGHTIELDHRLQTDPFRTVVVAKVQGTHFGKFAVGVGSYHNTAASVEFDGDGAKCVWPSHIGTQVDFLKGWTVAPAKQWFYLVLSIRNPYPYTTSLTASMTKPVRVACALFDAAGHLLGSAHPATPPSNVSYPGLDDVYIRTWDSNNDYRIDWFYAGPATGSPVPRMVAAVP